MNVLFLVLFFVLIILLIIVMFLLLKRLIFKINQLSMDYFLDKLKAYDNLIEEKEKKIKELNELINNKEFKLYEKENNVNVTSNNPTFLYDLKDISYKDEDIFKRMKEVNNKFNFSNKKIVSNFLKNNFDMDAIDDYNKYCEVRDKLDSGMVFDILTKKESKQMDMVRGLLGDYGEIFDSFMKDHKKFDLKKFISYLNKIIKQLDPYIYIYVGNKKENYDDINEYIHTEYDDSIFKGIKIIYRGKLYDYSI